MAPPVPLHVMRVIPKSSLSVSADKSLPSAKKVRFVLLHGFLAHSGSLNSLVVNLRRGLDKHNNAILSSSAAVHSAAKANGAEQLIDYEIISLDARNHGLSPHTPDHVLPDLVADFGHYLNTAKLEGVANATTPAVTIGIGHSMGSGTLAYYLMRREAALRRGFFDKSGQHSKADKCFSRFGVSSVPHSPELFIENIDAFVSLDMPPITGSEMSDKLHHELMEMLVEMEKVDLSNIFDMRSAREEFVRCGISNIRILGLCSTNLLLTRPRPDASSATALRSTARWKCNLTVLKRSLEQYSLFLPDGFQEHREDFQFPLQVPVLSILGGDSPIGGRKRFQKDWPRFAANLEQHVIPNATHTVFFDKPVESATIIFSFLRRLGVLSRR